MSQDSQTTGEPVQLLNGIQEAGNGYSEDRHNDQKMKLSTDLGQYGKEE